MKTRAAVLREVNAPWSVEEIELDDPQPREILVKTLAAGMCHSDEHAHNGSMTVPLPVVGGHEGAGEVIAIGEGVTEFAVGDHIACSFIPSCGKCTWCARGMQNLCDLGAHLLEPGMMAGGFRHHSGSGEDITPLLKLGTFAEHMVLSVDSAVKIENDNSRRASGSRELWRHHRIRLRGQSGRRHRWRHRCGRRLWRCRHVGGAGSPRGRRQERDRCRPVGVQA